MVYMNIDQDEIISTSPETLVRLENRRLTTFPVAGSRPRGDGDEEDRRLEEELLADEKELSEHNMLVDLGRNDIGPVSYTHLGSLLSSLFHQRARLTGTPRQDISL